MADKNHRMLLVGGNKPLVGDEEDIPSPPAKGLVVKVHYAGICHSDLAIQAELEGLYFERNLPLVMGHEIAGTVHSIGSDCSAKDESELSIGDPVLVYSWGGCLNCRYCDDDMPACRKKVTPESNEYGITHGGGYQEYCVVHDRRLVFKLPDTIPLDLGCMLGCSGLTTYNAITKVKPAITKAVEHEGKASLLIVGAGGLGLWTIQLVKAMLPPSVKITVADITKEKLEIAKKVGAHSTVHWTNESEEELIKKTREACGGGADASIDYVNITPTMNRAYNSLNFGATAVVVGLYRGAMPPLALNNLALSTVNIQGVYVGSRDMLTGLIEIVAAKKVVDPVPVTFVKLDEVNDTFDKLHKAEIEGRAIIKHAHLW